MTTKKRTSSGQFTPKDTPSSDASSSKKPSTSVGDVVTYDVPDTNGGTTRVHGLVVEVFEDRRQDAKGTWGDEEAFARVVQLPAAGGVPVADLNPDDDSDA
ncbi:hypothetical protein [Jatrophihabitans sp.]|uniref:hypothetical protein n=1 Tax=Jatrophihabitans sp. TaxID=1932789 RepID=UPI0030C75A69|nr:hypothetical protein [Jatrophihabitans sp.]